MADVVEVACPTCGFRWQEDLDWHREVDSIHTLRTHGRSGREQFRFRCPQDGTWVLVEPGASVEGDEVP